MVGSGRLVRVWSVLVAVMVAAAVVCGAVALPAGAEPPPGGTAAPGSPLTVAATPAEVAPGGSVAAVSTVANAVGADAAATLTTAVPPGFSLGGAAGPQGWSLEYSTDGGKTWSAGADVARATHVRAAGQLPASPGAAKGLTPLTPVGALQFTGAGDGYNAAFYRDKLFIANHHERATDARWLKCFDRATGAPCQAPFPNPGVGTWVSQAAGTPFGQGPSTLDTPNASIGYVNQSTGRMYIPTQVAAASGTSEVGWVCADLAALKSCGFVAAGVEEAPTDFGGADLFAQLNPAQAWAPTATGGLLLAVGGSGRVYCLDAATGTLCPTSGLAAVAQQVVVPNNRRFAFAAVAGASIGDAAPTHAFTVSAPNDTTWMMQCVDLATGARCLGAGGSVVLPAPHPTEPATSYSQPLPMYAPDGRIAAVCTLGQAMYAAPAWVCLDLAGGRVPVWEQRMGTITPAEAGHFGGRVRKIVGGVPSYEMSLMMTAFTVGQRMYVPWVSYPGNEPDDAVNSVACFDFAAGAACAGFSPPTGSYRKNIVYTVARSDTNPDCLWWSGDRGRLQAFDARTGALGCAPLSQTELRVQPQSCAATDSWHYTRLAVTGLPSTATATVRLYDQQGALLPQGQGALLRDGDTVDLSALPVAGPTAALDVEVTATAPALVDLGPAQVVVGWDAPGAQLCAQLLARASCEASDGTQVDSAAGIVPPSGAPVDVKASAPVRVLRGEGDCVLALRKLVNGTHAPDPPGVQVPGGSGVEYAFEVSTPGSFSLGTPVLTDDNTTPDSGDDFAPTYVDGDTNGDGHLDPGEVWRYRHSAKALDKGTATNTATATAPGATNNPVQDKGVYTAVPPSIAVVKRTNGAAATAPGLELVAGDKVTWAYEVRNTGPTPLKDVALTDSVEGEVTCPKAELAAGEAMTCTAEGAAVDGPYANTATATGTDPGSGTQVSAGARNEYLGLRPAVSIVKKINGAGTFADDGSPQRIPLGVGAATTTTFEVRNTGTAPLVSVAVTDQQLTAGGTVVPVQCPSTTLAVGAAMTCQLTGTALIGTHDDLAKVTGTGAFGNGTPLTRADGSAVPPVTDTSKAGYEAKAGPTPSPSPSPTAPSPSPTKTPPTPGPTPGPATSTGPRPATQPVAQPQQPVQQQAQPAPAAPAKLATTGAPLFGILLAGGLLVAAGAAAFWRGR